MAAQMKDLALEVAIQLEMRTNGVVDWTILDAELCTKIHGVNMPSH